MLDASSENHRVSFSPTQRLLPEDLLLEVLTQLGEGVVTLAVDGTIRGWNPRVTSLTGYSACEANTKGWAQLFDPSLRMAQIIEQARDGIPTTGERLTLTCSDGSRRPVWLWCLPLPGTNGAEVQILAVLREATPTRPQKAHAQDRLRLLGQLAGSVSHEIYNPLNAILLHADILEEELSQSTGDEREHLLHSLEVMKTRLTQLYELIQEYLVLSRLADIHFTPEDLGALLEAFGLEMRERLLTHGITLSLEGSAVLGQVPLHKPIFWRALGNVVQYAVEAMPHGGTLTLHGQRFETHVRLDIHDTGGGLSEQQLDCLSSPSSAMIYEGKGLGLYLVREVVSAHHGQITVSNTPGTGTTITVTLPAVDELPGV